MLAYVNGEPISRAQYIWGSDLEQILQNATSRLNIRRAAKVIFSLHGQQVNVTMNICHCVRVTFLDTCSHTWLLTLANWEKSLIAWMCHVYSSLIFQLSHCVAEVWWFGEGSDRLCIYWRTIPETERYAARCRNQSQLDTSQKAAWTRGHWYHRPCTSESRYWCEYGIGKNRKKRYVFLPGKASAKLWFVTWLTNYLIYLKSRQLRSLIL